MGAWIEINPFEQGDDNVIVAPLVGAWIEISEDQQTMISGKSLPLWERGLKFVIIITMDLNQSRSPCGSVD